MLGLPTETDEDIIGIAQMANEVLHCWRENAKNKNLSLNMNYMQKKNSDNSITIKDIASLCGVSISTVSNVLNSKTNKVSKEVADKIMEVVEQTGYKSRKTSRRIFKW